MTAVASTIPRRAFIVWFRDLHRWSVGSFVETGWRWPAETIRSRRRCLGGRLTWTAPRRQPTRSDW
jgi:hypothetical protein